MKIDTIYDTIQTDTIYDGLIYFRFQIYYGLNLKKMEILPYCVCCCVRGISHSFQMCAISNKTKVNIFEISWFYCISYRKERKRVRNRIRGSTRKKCCRTEKGRRSSRKREETKIYLLLLWLLMATIIVLMEEMDLN